MTERIYRLTTVSDEPLGISVDGGEEVVRCRDCRHYSEHEWVVATDVDDVCHFWHGEPTKVSPDGFCAWGERNDDSAPKNDVSEEIVDANDADSREKILADLEKLTHKWHDYDGNFMRIYSDVAYAQAKELLERQDAITRAEFNKPGWEYCETCVLSAQSDALRAERDNLAHDLAECERERERWRGLCSRLLDLAEKMKAAAAAACE